MANTTRLQLLNSPIVEAVFDFDCDLPSGFDLTILAERLRGRLGVQYPMFRGPVFGAFQFRQRDEKQVVQVRQHGFSFNRLAPYSTLDEYLPEIERTWRIYVELAAPFQIRTIRLRNINKIPLPLTAGTVDLGEYLTVAPRLPEEDSFVLAGFLNQQTAVEKATGHHINLVLTAEPVSDPASETFPVILDITVASQSPIDDPTDWSKIMPAIASLRSLKYRIFSNTLTKKCIKLFQ